MRRVSRRLARQLRDGVNRGAVALARVGRLGEYVVLDYPASARTAAVSRERGRMFDAIAAGEEEYVRSLRTIASFTDALARVPVHADDERTPSWDNGFLPGLDAAALYAFIRSRAPRTYVEIGSGSSTRWARRAIDDGGLSTRLVSIDPRPRSDVDSLCDLVVRRPLETADPALFGQLESGDVVFVDGSHRVFTGSDATVFVLELLPALAPGVLVGVHDVYLPDDYPAGVAGRHYSEQYLLGALLLAGPGWLRPALAADYVSKRDTARRELRDLWDRRELKGAETHGVALWLEVAARVD